MALMSGISASMGYGYTHFPLKQQIKFRQLMDPFLDRLLEESDPNYNMREAMKKRMLKNDK